MNEHVSALLDGQLDQERQASTLAALQRDAALRDSWATYCLIGDAIRQEEPLMGDFSQRVMAALEQEPTVLVPRAAVQPPVVRGWAANLLPLAASVAGVALVGWLALSLPTNRPAELAAAPQPVNVLPVQANLADASLTPDELHREYLLAHQGMAADGPIPGVVQYVRTVSDVRQGADQ